MGARRYALLITALLSHIVKGQTERNTYGALLSINNRVPLWEKENVSVAGHFPALPFPVNTLSINYTRLIADIHSFSIIWSNISINEKWKLLPGMYYRYWGKFTGMDEKGEFQGYFYVHEISPSIASVHKFGKFYTGISLSVPFYFFYQFMEVNGVISWGATYIDTTKDLMIGIGLSDFVFPIKRTYSRGVYGVPWINCGIAFPVYGRELRLFFSIYDILRWQMPDYSSSFFRSLLSLKTWVYHLLSGITYRKENLEIMISFDSGQRIRQMSDQFSFVFSGFAAGIKFISGNFSVVYAIKPFYGDFISHSLTIDAKVK